MHQVTCKVRAFTFAVVLSAAVVASPLVAQQVMTDYDHTAHFEQFHTFSFGTVHASTPIVEQRIKAEVTRVLTARGLQMTPNGGDIMVVAIGGMKAQQEYSTFYDGLGGGFGWRRGWGGGGFGNATTTVSEIPVGTLVVDMYATGQHQLLFRGTASDQLSSDSDKNTNKLNKAIDKIFKKYPPKSAM